MNISENGFEIFESFISQPEMDAIKTEVEGFSEDYAKYGIRGANEKFKTIHHFCSSEKLLYSAEFTLQGKPNLPALIIKASELFQKPL